MTTFTRLFRWNSRIWLFVLLIIFNSKYSYSAEYEFEENEISMPEPMLAPLSNISIHTWLDYNEDGITQSNEGGIKGVMVHLYNQNNNLISSGTTDASGNFMFNNLPDGKYRVKFSRFVGLVYTFQNRGNDDDKDSDIDISGYSDYVVVSAATYSTNYYITGGYRGNLKVSLGNNISICEKGSIELNANTFFGKSPFTYSWANGLGSNQTLTVSPDVTTKYSVTVTDAWGFSAESDILVRVKRGIGEEKFLIIDDFSAGESSSSLHIMIDNNNLGPIVATDHSDKIIGNYRNLSLEYVDGPPRASLEIDYNQGIFTHSNDVGTISKASLCYNRNGAGLHTDISGYEYFKLKDIGVDQGEMTVKVTLVDVNNDISTNITRIPGLGNQIVFDKEIPLDEFINYSTIDKTDIIEICFEFYTLDRSIDYRLGDIEICEFTECEVNAFPDKIEMCVGDTVKLNVEASCTNSVFFYWDQNLGYGESHIVSPNETTTFVVEATDAYGCLSMDSIVVIVHEPPVITLPDDMSMCQEDSLEIKVSVDKGTPPYTYLWNTGETSDKIKVSPNSSTSYSVQVWDSKSCTSSEESINIEVFPKPTVIVSSTKANCQESDGTATAIASGGTPPYTYLWNTGETSNKLSNVFAGSYSVSITDVNGCEVSSDVIIEEENCGLIGNFVWEDKNANGIQDIEDIGISGVKVFLLDGSKNPIDTTETDENGFYYFFSLIEGDYYVEFEKPENYITTLPNIGDDKKDSDIEKNTGFTSLIQLAKYEKDSTYDAGFYKFASLGDRVWLDKNGNGLQDTDEIGYEGMTVELYDCDDNLIATKITDDSGKYLFDSLVPGIYNLKFVLPSGMKFTSQNIGADDSMDSDVDILTGKTICEELTSGEENTTYDAGIYIPARLGNYVWEDLNADGVQEDGELPMGNIAVILNDCNNNPIDTVYTDDDGHYIFDNLKPGGYKISLIQPDLYILTSFNKPDDTKDSDIEADGFSTCEQLESGEDNDTYDIGMYRLATIGNFVWIDKNGNGLQDSDESGIEGVEVQLQDCNGVILESKTTDESGKYLYDSLTPGDYRIKFILPTDYFFTSLDNGNDLVDSDADLIDGTTVCENLISGETNLSYDAGIFKKASIGNKVWLDDDADGIQDPDEVGVENVVVKLFDCDDNLITEQQTDNLGNYLFENLNPGQYKLFFVAPTDHTFTDLNIGSDDEIDSDVDAAGYTDCEDLESGENNLKYDAGLAYYGSLGDFVWEDKNGDGIQQADEPVIENIEIKLFQKQNTEFVYLRSEFTDNNGKYLFDKLVPGEYYIKVVLIDDYDVTLSNKGADSALDSDIDDSNGANTSKTIELSGGEDDLTWDIGLFKCATIGDLIWSDYVKNSIFDSNEGGIDGIEVRLYRFENENWILWDNTYSTYRPGTVCGSGYWSFCTMPGRYYVEFANMQDLDYIHVQPNVGDDEDIDSDIDDSFGVNTTNEYTLFSGDSITNVYGGFYKEYSITGKTWLDLNENGVRDTDEELLENIEVYLHDASGYISSSITDTEGNYIFEDLANGDYYLRFELPAEHQFTTPNIGDAAYDSDVTQSVASNSTNWFNVPGGTLSNIDAGYISEPSNPGATPEGIIVSPNPTSNIINFDYFGEVGEKIDIFILKLNGEVLYKNEGVILKEKKYKESVNVKDFSGGLYQILIKSNIKSKYSNFLKIK